MKLAVVFFNLGGPDGPAAVRPFLFNLFRDPAIIQLPTPARLALAALISTTRAPSARKNYAIMGGGSPLLPETLAQARALEGALGDGDGQVRVFTAMRYWKPFTEAVAREVADFAPDEIVLLPLYPQYSTTTSASSLKAWAKAYKGPGRSRVVCCYPTATGLIEAHVTGIRAALSGHEGQLSNLRLLFSAHGLPQQVVDQGDPYAAQVEAMAAAIAARVPEFTDWHVCYQSRVGRLKWLTPYTEDAIRQAAADGKGVLLCPVAFVSEHVETLVELDHEYRDLAREAGMATYLRARTPGVNADFIAELAAAVRGALGRTGTAPHGPWRCPAGHGKCACAGGTASGDLA